MTKRSFAYTLICLGGISITALTLKASGPEDGGVISFKGRVNWALATKPSAAIHAVNPNTAKLVTIFTNLGKPGHLYEGNVAWDVAGPDSGVQEQWVAMPFTPTFDAAVTQISVAVEHNTGSPNSFVLSLNADGGGLVPGSVIRRWVVKNAPKFGTCCTLDVAKDAQGVKIAKGKQYWVVAKTNASQTGTRMEWDLSPKAIEENFAFNNGQGWYEYTAFGSAFAVYGKRLD